jgi:hypothetical protein
MNTRPTTTWREHFESARSDDSTRVIAVAPDEATLDVPFYDGYGGSEGPAVLIWTEARVYFPVVYDGSEWIASAPRNPVAEGQHHVGGE